jgi:UDP-4-amino-4,6-dideoxy-N-acetyl-beta-L-altrosamine transaminase
LPILPYARQSIGPDDIRAVTRVLQSDFLTQGPEVVKFEREFAEMVGARFAVACSSATAGLHLSAMALGVGPGERWWTSPNTFCATADAALRCGADVDFIDIEWGTYNMDLGLLEKHLQQAARKNKLPKVVAPVHFAGNPVDMGLLNRLQRRYGFKVVEDAAHATGAKLKGEPVGSCRWSDLCVFSFHAVKIITTGEGGMITTRSPKLYEKLLRLRTHGVSRDTRDLVDGRKSPWYYEKLELGNHYRLTDFQAALGRSQLKKIRQFQACREKIAASYTENLGQFPLDLPRLTSGAQSSWHLYPICVRGGVSARDRAMNRLRRAGIQVNLHYLSVPRFQFYRNRRQRPYLPCPVAERFAEKEISLPIFPGLKPKEQARVVREIGKWIH